jgi:hypothetical protein
MAGVKYPTIGCCGVDCGLCPRHYTNGASCCPGCGGDNFEKVHPSCGYLNCCVKKRSLAVCGQCDDYPCKRFEKETGERDSFVLHRCVIPNQKFIRENGLETFLALQSERITFLELALEKYDDGRSKNFFCIVAALLSIDSLKSALERAGTGEILRTVLEEYATAEGQELKLRK